MRVGFVIVEGVGGWVGGVVGEVEGAMMVVACFEGGVGFVLRLSVGVEVAVST